MLRPRERERERERERNPTRLHAVSTEPDLGSNSHTVRSRPELKQRVGCVTN